MQKLKHPTWTHIIITILVLIAFSTSLSAWIVQAQIIVSENDGIPAAESGMALDTRFDGQDRLRVIVQLKVPGQEKSAELMTPAIHQAQRELMGEVKSGEVRVIHEYDYIPFMALEVNRAGFEALQKNPNVIAIEEDVLMKPMLQQSVPLINADDVWLEGVTGAGQVVAILDTGVDKNHPALAGKVVSEACYSSNTDSTSSLCPGGVSESTEPDSGLPCLLSDCDHGTHVAGIVAADGIYNAKPIKGVAPDAKLIAIQVFSQVNSSSLGSWSTDQIKGLERVYELRNYYNIAAVNLSLGSEYPYATECDHLDFNQAYKQIVDTLRNAGIATVAAAGNDGRSDAISSPACISSVISVGATTKDDLIASYSNRDDFLDLLAPGNAILSTIPDDLYAYSSGTSMATPHVAGAWALMKSHNSSIDVDDLLNIFKVSGVLITDTTNGFVYPRIDVLTAFELLNLYGPKNLTASDGALQAFISLEWNDLIEATYYKVYRSPINESENATLLSPNPMSNTFEDTSASEGIIYYYWVKACNDTYCSDFSEPDTGWLRYIGDPPPPQGVAASDGEFTDKVQISWYGVGGEISYKVFRNTVNSTLGAITLTESDLSSPFEDTTALHNTEYYYWVQACDVSGCSVYSQPDTGYLLDDFYIFLPLINKNYLDVDSILNGDFEEGPNAAWVEFSSNDYELILQQENLLVTPKSGSWAVWLGGDLNETSRLSQNVPISSSGPYLHFWYWIGSEDYCGYDYFNVKVNNVIINTINLCGVNNSTNWGEKVINLSAYSGSNINLMFEVVTDGTFNSNLFLDNVSMSASSSVASSLFTSQISTEDYSKSRK